MTRFGMRLSIYDLDTGEDIVYDSDSLEGTTEEQLQMQAAGMAFGLAEDFAGYRYGIEEDEDDSAHAG